MRFIPTVLALSLALGASVALAKQGVKDPGVKKRVEGMEGMAMDLKLLANMAKGKMDFTAGDAAQAKAAMLDAAKAIPSLFQPHDTDPASDAKDAIWTDWAGFTATAAKAKMAVELIDTDTQDGLQTSLGQAMEACKACHQTYRN